MILKIEFGNTKITLSVTPEGVLLDAPEVMGQETRQTTLSEAQWEAYARGREDERNHRTTVDASTGLDFPGFEELEEVTAIVTDEWPANDPDEEPNEDDDKWVGLSHQDTDIYGNPRPPKVDPVTGNIAGWVKTFREAENKRRRAPEAQPRALCRSTCCGTLGARSRDGSCWGCR